MTYFISIDKGDKWKARGAHAAALRKLSKISTIQAK